MPRLFFAMVLVSHPQGGKRTFAVLDFLQQPLFFQTHDEPWAASSSGGVYGTVLGIVAGAIPVMVVLSLQRGFPLVIPWLQMGASMILVPLFGAAAAWVLTKGKLPMTRRQTLA